MLGENEPIGFLHTTDITVARRFYVDLLGLEFCDESPFALVVRSGPIQVRIAPVDDLEPQPFAVFGWWVDDIDALVDRLSAHGVDPIRYEGLDQDDRGVWTAPGGARVAWIHDPDHNTLSFTQR